MIKLRRIQMTLSGSTDPYALRQTPQGTARLFNASVAVFALLVFVSAADSAKASDLLEAYEKAKTYDAEFQAAQYDLEAARQLIPQARSAFLPQLTLGAEAGLSTIGDDGQGPFEETLVSLSLTQTLFNRSSGKLLDQAELAVLQAQAQYAALEQSLILRSATAYFDVLRAQANVDFSQSELQAISRQREQAERRFDVGLVPITDVRSAQAQYDLAVAQEIAAADQYSTAQEALRRISGIEVDLLTPLAEDLPLTPPEPNDIDAWVELALQQNLELVVARLASESSATEVEVQRAGRLPTIALVGSAASSTTEQIPQNDRELAEIKLQLQMPLLSGGRVNAQIAQAKADARAAEQQLLSQERTTTQQTRDGFRGVRASIARARALRQALVSTEKSAEATEAGFRAGTQTSVEVLQELRDTYRAQSDYAGARYDYIINTLNLKAATGTLKEDDIIRINRFLTFPD